MKDTLKQNKENAINLKKVFGSVEYKNVSFSYINTIPVIKNISFKAAPGDMIALVGASGSGKTTLLSVLSGLDKPDDPFFSHHIRWKNTSKIKSFFSEQIKNSNKDYNGFIELIKLLPEDYSKWDIVTKAQYLETMIFLSNYLLSSQGDRVAMAHSVEMRLPYLDYRVIELMGKVNSELKINGLNEKYLLKQIFKNRLPESILNRSKNPYRAPITKAILKSNRNLVKEYCSEESLKKSGLFDTTKVVRLINKLEKFSNASEVDDMALVGILSTQIIYKTFIENFQYNYNRLEKFDLFFDQRSFSKN